MDSTIKDVLWWGLGVFSYVLKISSVSIYLCLGLGSLWFYFGTAVYAALGYSFGWNKLDVCYAFCIYIRIREIGIERNFVVQWSVFKNKEKRGRLGLNRIIGSLLMYNGVCGHQVWSLVSLNHGQTIRSLYGRSFGNSESEVISTATLWFVLRWHKARVFIWSKLLATSCATRYILNGGRIGSYIWPLMTLDTGLLRIVAGIFKQELFIHYLQMQEDKMRMNAFEFTLAGSIMESNSYLETKTLLLIGEYGKIFDIHRFNNWDCETMMLKKVLAWIFWLNFMVWWLRFQGIFKPKLNSSWEPFRSLYNEST